MMHGFTRLCVFLMIALLVGLMLTGCGRKGPPLPPLKEAPAQADTETQEKPAEPTGLPQDELEEEHDTPAVPPYP